MITGKDFYNVMTAMVPLYVAMVLAYGSIKWWRIFSPEQCAGINRFVATFAVPLLSFNFIASNNPYKMNLRFIGADTLQKAIILVVLAIWSNVTKRGCLEWAITLFSLSTLPNTLVMGIPLFKGMYGDSSGTLMVQIVFFQGIVWYTLLLFLFELRTARMLFSEQFPDTADSIVSIHVDSDVISLDGRQEPIETETDIKEDGKLHVTVRRSSSSRRFRNLSFITTVPSNLSNNVEIYSLHHSTRNPMQRVSSSNYPDFYSTTASGGGRNSNFGALNVFGRSASVGGNPRLNYQGGTGIGDYPSPNPEMFSHTSAMPKNVASNVIVDGQSQQKQEDLRIHGAHDHKEIELTVSPRKVESNRKTLVECQEKDNEHEEGEKVIEEKPKTNPRASVMIRVLLTMVWRKLIRNPNTYASIIGLIWSLVSYRWNVKMPAIIAQSISIMSNTGLGMSMFSLGLFMALQPRIISCGKRVAVSAMAVKFLLGPGVMAAASFAVGLRGVILQIAIVQAALPLGIVPFVFAKEYNLHPEILSTS
ncbi:hypothetical protein TanjilG_05136 [Lupinus angustifolius]|uniref:Auxin efflux carrier component n=2 Tax=Lupinus angustifolius TaxID=3871 RepID=A0A1J7GSR6_LUPAN|nr:hypothetical protein TanjilG_05136 [Lupinus angustifolius]